MSQLLKKIPQSIPVAVLIEIVDRSAPLDLPGHEGAEASWRELPDGAEPGAAMVDAVMSLGDMPPVAWVAGEAVAVQKVRKDLLRGRGIPRSAAMVRCYRKHGRSAT